MILRREAHFLGHQSCELFYQTWSDENPRATLVVTHGMAEHSECYQRLAEAMVPRGWELIAWDLRGHGRSEGQRGYVGNFREFSEDLALFVGHLGQQLKLKKPFALLGHSMGGLITLLTVMEHGLLGAKAVALSSPLLGIALPVPAIKDFIARSLERLIPRLTLYNEIRYEDLSHDQTIVESYRKDALRHEKIAPTLYLGMLEAMSRAQKQAAQLTAPILIQSAGQDRIVSLEETKHLFANLGSQDKTHLIYQQSFHEIFNDLEREKVYNDLHTHLCRILGLS